MANIHINVKQLLGKELNVPSVLIIKLYNLLKKWQRGEDSWDCEPESIRGTIKTGYTYDIYVNALKNYFGDNFNIECDGYYIHFEDPLVESTIVDKIMSVEYPTNNFEGVIPELSERLSSSGNTQTQGFRRIFYSRPANANDTTDYIGSHITSFDEISKFDGLITLASGEFWDCKQLNSVDLTRVKFINVDVFRGCDNLQYFNGINSTKGDLRLPNLVFNGLKTSAFSNYETSSGSNVWKGPQVKRILDLGALTQLESAVFYGTKVLTYIDGSVLANLLTIGDSTFSRCSNLTCDNFDVSNLTRIGNNAFWCCTSLDIPDLKLPSITSINGGAFEQVPIHKISELGYCTIGSGAFRDNPALTEITDEAFASIKTLGNNVFYNDTNLVIEDLKLPSLTSIGNSAFTGTKVKVVSDLGSITTIQGFNNCTQLRYVNIPITAQILGDGAFSNCQNLDITRFFDYDLLYDNNCLSGITTLPTIIPYTNSRMGYTPFKQSNVQTIYAPRLIDTNGINGKQVPCVGRGSKWSFRSASSDSNLGNMFIFYMKDIQKINGFAFGGWDYGNQYSTKLTLWGDTSSWTTVIDKDHTGSLWYNTNFPSSSPYRPEIPGRHLIDNTVVSEYRPNGPIPYYCKNEMVTYDTNKTYQTWDQWHESAQWANLRYLVINNPTPPTYWQSTSVYGSNVYTSLGLYQHADSGTNETFKQLVVPRSSIQAYLDWDAFPKYDPEGVNGRFDYKYTDSNGVQHYALDDNDRAKFYNNTKFDNSDEYNPRIIALESMGHFDTKAQYDAAPDIPPPATEHHEKEAGYGDGIHNKNEFLIVEYMGLQPGETINWDNYPSWSPKKKLLPYT